MKLHINPFNTSNPINIKDAVIISTIAASSTYVLTFFANVSLGQITADPALFAFDSVKTWLVSFFGTMVTLAGLDQYVKRTEEKPHV